MKTPQIEHSRSLGDTWLQIAKLERVTVTQYVLAELAGTKPIGVFAVAVDHEVRTDVVLECNQGCLNAPIVGEVFCFAEPQVHPGPALTRSLRAFVIANALDDEWLASPVERHDELTENRIRLTLNSSQGNSACLTHPLTVRHCCRELIMIVKRQLFFPSDDN